MLPSNLRHVHTQLNAAIRKHRVERIRAAIEQAAEPQIVLSGEGHRSGGDIHEAARKIDPTIPADYDKAFRRPGIEKMMQIVDEHEKVAGAGGPVGASRVGGNPDLPPDLDWPTVKGKHLPFIAQVELSTLPAWEGCPLPRAGWLWTFAGGDFPMDAALLHWSGDRSRLERREPPPKGSMNVGEFVGQAVHRPIPVTGVQVVPSVPGYGSDWWNEHVGDEEELEDAMMDFCETLMPDTPTVTLLGRLSSDEESPTELAREHGKRKGADWISLLEVSSVGSMCWSDSGTLAFLIRSSALAKNDWSDPFVIVCSS